MHYYIDKEELLSFEYDGLSSAEFGIVITKINDLSSAERNVEIIEVDGRDSAIINDKGNYKPFELKIECAIDATDENIKEVARNIKKWLQYDCSYKKLILSDDVDYYCEAVFVNKLDIEEVIEQLGEVELKFMCKPLKRLVDGENKVVLTEANTIINQYMKSKPIIKIVADGDVTLNINSQVVELKGLESEIEIDSEIMNAYKIVDGKTLLQNNKMYSDFPFLEAGENAISWTGEVSQIEITPRWVVL